MSLTEQAQTRWVVLHPDTSVHDAARAMEDNHIGAVIVCEGSTLVGIVTDRDLARLVVGGEHSPERTPLRAVMTHDVATLPANATAEQAATLMIERAVRRVPLVEGGNVVGLLTLDDLIAGTKVAAATLGFIVRSQLLEPAKLKPRAELRPRIASDPQSRAVRAEQRHASRAKGSFDALIRHLLATTRMTYEEEAVTAVEIVVGGVLQRITPEEADDFRAQLPALLQERLVNTPLGPNRAISRRSIEDDLVRRLRLDAEQASQVIDGVGLALGQSISEGELDDIRGQLPADLRTLFDAPPVNL